MTMHATSPWRPTFWTAVFSLCIALLGAAHAASAPLLTAVYPNLNGNGKDNLGYRVLELALQKSGDPYKLTVDKQAMNDDRARQELDHGRISVADFGSGADFEERFSAIYFPIDRGLLGYRLAIIAQSSVAAFAEITSLEDLRKFTAGQGLGWSNNVIMEAAGIRVQPGPTLASLFPMLEAGRFDFLPLGLNEVYGFLDEYKSVAPQLVVDTHVVLIYRFARLFYVKKDNLALRDLLLDGLAKSFNDGSFQKLLSSDPAIQTAIERAKLSKRTAIVIDNPTMTGALKSIPEKYFFKPAEFK
jgi:ABC-type amino acid transport substrate-binding protein